MKTLLTEEFLKRSKTLFGRSLESFEDLVNFYWLPYDWRPKQIWYRFKCLVWHRYTTIRPRTMPWHTWTDRCELLPHMIMEIATQFVEKEMIGGHVDWESDDEHKEFYQAMLDHVNWWKECQNYELDEFLPKFVEGPEHGKEMSKGVFRWDMEPVDENLWRWYHICVDAHHQELTERCMDIVKRRSMMWT